MTNCLLWCIHKRLTAGGKINVIKSITWLGFHTTWTDEYGDTWEYTVRRPIKRPWWYVPLFYKGIVKKVKK